MEKFADRYCENNAEVFATADVAYTLAFSIIMLNTDLHRYFIFYFYFYIFIFIIHFFPIIQKQKIVSPQIKTKMTKPQFIKNNRGINNGQDLESSYLEDIYEDILNDEIILQEEHASFHKNSGVLTAKQKTELSKLEMDHLSKKLLAVKNLYSFLNFLLTFFFEVK